MSNASQAAKKSQVKWMCTGTPPTRKIVKLSRSPIAASFTVEKQAARRSATGHGQMPAVAATPPCQVWRAVRLVAEAISEKSGPTTPTAIRISPTRWRFTWGTWRLIAQ